jgi:hypothetical protein
MHPLLESPGRIYILSVENNSGIQYSLLNILAEHILSPEYPGRKHTLP